jgi:hypothetical protein
MNKTKKDTHILFSDFELEKEVLDVLKTELEIHNADSVIVDISNINVSTKLLSELNKLSDIHKENGMSFVLVVKGVSADDVDETFTISPTLHEAQDIIVMEDLERELGF